MDSWLLSAPMRRSTTSACRRLPGHLLLSLPDVSPGRSGRSVRGRRHWRRRTHAVVRLAAAAGQWRPRRRHRRTTLAGAGAGATGGGRRRRRRPPWPPSHNLHHLLATCAALLLLTAAFVLFKKWERYLASPTSTAGRGRRDSGGSLLQRDEHSPADLQVTSDPTWSVCASVWSGPVSGPVWSV